MSAMQGLLSANPLTAVRTHLSESADLGKERIGAFINRASEVWNDLKKNIKAAAAGGANLACTLIGEAIRLPDTYRRAKAATKEFFAELKKDIVEGANNFVYSRIEKSNLAFVKELRQTIAGLDCPPEKKAELSKFLASSLDKISRKYMADFAKDTSATARRPIAQKFKADLAKSAKALKELIKQAIAEAKLKAAYDKAQAELTARTSKNLAPYADVIAPELATSIIPDHEHAAPTGTASSADYEI